jgi:ATP phosphoribosyltransferase regulatory subunit
LFSDTPSPAPGILAQASGATHNPLPPGMRDVLPPKARLQSRVGARIMKSFELFGYARVWLPTFEYASVLERTPSGVGGALRFVEPETGEVVALRADMTPQVARVVSTRYAARSSPVRLCYQGSVLRRRRERARTESQVVQAGVELIGLDGIEADFEVLAAMSAAGHAAGLRQFVISIGHAGVAAALFREVAEPGRQALNDALAAKDPLVLRHWGNALNLAPGVRKALDGLLEMQGGAEVFGPATALLKGTPAEPAALELRALCERVMGAGLAPQILVDFGEASRLDYYTGPMFQVLAEGPGEALAAGGRYDHLYPRYGLNRPAAGCAFDVNNVCWALERAGFREPEFPKVALPKGSGWALQDALRAAQIVCAVTEGEPAHYAADWGWDFWLDAGPPLEIVGKQGGRARLTAGSPAEQAQQILGFVQQNRSQGGDAVIKP